MTNKFVSIMEQIGKDALKALTEVEKYLPPVATLIEILFPEADATVAALVNATGLIQKAVVLAEQKMAAAGQQTGTGLQKSSDVISTVEPTVLQLLTESGISTADTAYVQKIIDAVVADLNVRSATPSASAA